MRRGFAVLVALAVIATLGTTGCSIVPNTLSKPGGLITLGQNVVKEAPDILVEDSTMDFWAGYRYTGVVICKDSSIYIFDASKDSDEQSYGTDLKKMSKRIFGNAKLCEDKVSPLFRSLTN